LDVFLLMNPPVEELNRWRVWETLDALRRSGKIKYIGVSVAEPADGVWLLRQNLPVDVLEVAFSIFYQGATTELLPLARKRKVGILAREPLANGFLSGKYAEDATFGDGDIRAALPREYVQAMTQTAAQLQFLTQQGQRTLAQAALRFALDDPAVSSVIVGAKTPAQMEENCGAVNISPISETEREQIAAVF
jgi:aryl-alcohol dehydrogenase-like predicted oxidoreductase